MVERPAPETSYQKFFAVKSGVVIESVIRYRSIAGVPVHASEEVAELA